MPVPARYRYRFPVVRHDVDRLALSVIELPPQNVIYVAEVQGYVVPLSVIKLPLKTICVAEVQGYVVPLSVIELLEKRITIAEVQGYVVPLSVIDSPEN